MENLIVVLFIITLKINRFQIVQRKSMKIEQKIPHNNYLYSNFKM